VANVQIFDPNGPTAGVTGSWECHFGFIIDNRAWVSTNTEGTTSALVIETNTGAQMNSTVSGTVLTVINLEEVFQTFTMTIRSGDIVGSGGIPCGE